MRNENESIRAIIADDEALARRRLRALLQRHPDVAVVAECGTGVETLEAAREHRPDLLFLDVQMPEASGVDVLDALEPGVVGAVVMVTAFDDFAVTAFNHYAVDYLLKPVEEDRFATAMDRVRTRLADRTTADPGDVGRAADALRERERAAGSYLNRFLLRSAQKVTVLDVAEVDWIEADGDYLRLHGRGKVHMYRGAIGAIEQRLDPADFVRVHRSTIVRASQIRELEPYFHGDFVITLADGCQVRLSRTYRARVQEVLGHPF